MEAIGRREVMTLAGVAASTVLTACTASRASAPPVAIPHVGVPVTHTPQSAQRGTLPASVVSRIGDSFMPGALATRRDLHSLTDARAVLVGDIDAVEMQDCQKYVHTSITFIEKLTGIHLDHKYLVMLPRTTTEFESWAGQRNADDVGIFVGPIDSSWLGWVVIQCAAQTGAGRTLVQDGIYLSHVIRHALFVANTLADGADGYGAAKWVVEGYAEFVGNTAGLVFPRKPPPATVPKDSEFGRESQTHAQDRAFMFVDYLVTRFGERSAMKFYKEATDASFDTTQHAFHAVFGIPLAVAAKGWAAQYKRQFAALFGRGIGT